MSRDINKSFVNVNYKCNNNCVSCIREKENKISEDPPLKKIFEKIDQILAQSGHIEFNGGEPTLREDLFKILEYTAIKKHGIEIALLTNCRRFSNSNYSKKLKYIKTPNFKIVTTIYGHNSKLHDATTRTPHSFEQQIKGIRNLIKSGIKVELRVVINGLNYKHLEDIARFIVKNFNRQELLAVVFVNMKIYGEAHKNRKTVAYKINEAMPYVEKSVKVLSQNKFKVHLFHFPHCMLQKYLWRLSKGVTAEKTEICFLPQCENCVQRKDCSGIWGSYVNLFGSSEFKPINF